MRTDRQAEGKRDRWKGRTVRVRRDRQVEGKGDRQMEMQDGKGEER